MDDSSINRCIRAIDECCQSLQKMTMPKKTTSSTRGAIHGAKSRLQRPQISLPIIGYTGREIVRGEPTDMQAGQKAGSSSSDEGPTNFALSPPIQKPIRIGDWIYETIESEKQPAECEETKKQSEEWIYETIECEKTKQLPVLKLIRQPEELSFKEKQSKIGELIKMKRKM